VILIEQLRAISEARLQDAVVLLENDRVDGAAYLCGYAIELATESAYLHHIELGRFPTDTQRI
jgi:hypothetical protein